MNENPKNEAVNEKYLSTIPEPLLLDLSSLGEGRRRTARSGTLSLKIPSRIPRSGLEESR